MLLSYPQTFPKGSVRAFHCQLSSGLLNTCTLHSRAESSDLLALDHVGTAWVITADPYITPHTQPLIELVTQTNGPSCLTEDQTLQQGSIENDSRKSISKMKAGKVKRDWRSPWGIGFIRGKVARLPRRQTSKTEIPHASGGLGLTGWWHPLISRQWSLIIRVLSENRF